MRTDVHGISLATQGDMVVRKHTTEPGGFEPHTIELWRAWAASDQPGILLDVGAYTGLYTIAGAFYGRWVTAFEPFSSAFDQLRANLRENSIQIGDQVTVMNAAVGDSSGWADAPARFPRGFITSGRSFRAVEERAGQAVPMVSIDETVGEMDVCAMKVDVEGSEPDVLLGALNMISRCRPWMIVEVLTEIVESDVREILEEFDYEFERVDDRNLICRPTDKIEPPVPAPPEDPEPVE